MSLESKNVKEHLLEVNCLFCSGHCLYFISFNSLINSVCGGLFYRFDNQGSGSVSLTNSSYCYQLKQ